MGFTEQHEKWFPRLGQKKALDSYWSRRSPREFFKGKRSAKIGGKRAGTLALTTEKHQCAIMRATCFPEEFPTSLDPLGTSDDPL